jgi:Domain of unknown function (DUF4349)
MTTTLHDFAPEEIMGHHDGELPVERAEQVSAHLNACAECRHLANSLRTTAQSLAAWSIDRVPPSFEPPVVNSLSPLAAAGSLLSWPSLPNRRVLLALGALASTISFVYLEIHNIRPSHMSVLRDAPRVDIDHYVKVPAVGAAGGGGGGGREGTSVDNAAVNRNSRSQQSDKLAEGTNETSRLKVFAKLAPAVTAPRSIADSNGQLHGLGDRATISFSAEQQPIAQAPMIARTAELQVMVKNFEGARSAVQSILARHQGYAASLDVSDPESAARILNASLRIPSEELPAALTELKLLGHVSNESQAGEEVTAQHVDLVARLKNSRETETRLQDILRNRTGKVADILEVEQEIARVRGEIEQMESERQSLEHRVDFATVNLTITEEYKAKVSVTTPGAATQFHNAAVAGYENVTASALTLALWLTEYLPPILFWMLLLAAPAAFLWRWRRRALASASPLG